MSKGCGSCKYFAQGKNCSYCEHPKQTDEGLKGYCYYTFGTDCNLFEKGISNSRAKYTDKLRKKEIEENEFWFFKILKRLRLL